MRISLCNEVIGELPFAQQCELVAALGYDGLEPAPFTFGDDPTRLRQRAHRRTTPRRERRRDRDHRPALLDARAGRAVDHDE